MPDAGQRMRDARGKHIYEDAAMKIVQAVKRDLVPNMDDNDGGELLSWILDFADQVAASPSPVSAPLKNEEEMPLARVDGSCMSTPGELPQQATSPSETTAPEDIQHNWQLTDAERQVYTCSQCSQWTANVPLYTRDVCPARERRVGERRRDYEA